MAYSHFHKVLRERIQEEVDSRVLSLASGGAPDYPQYRDSVGYIRGLHDALRLCEEIERESD